MIGGWKDFMFWNEKFPGIGNPYNLFEYLLNKDIDIQMNPLKNNRFSTQEAINYIRTKKRKKVPVCEMPTSWVFVLLNASNFPMETEDNSIQRKFYDSYII